MAAKAILKSAAGLLGIPSMEILWRKIALGRYEAKRRSDEGYRQWLEMEGSRIRTHYAHEEVTEVFASAHVSSQLYEILRKLKERLGPLLWTFQ